MGTSSYISQKKKKKIQREVPEMHHVEIIKPNSQGPLLLTMML